MKIVATILAILLLIWIILLHKSCSKQQTIIIPGKDSTITITRTVSDTIQSYIVKWKTLTDTVNTFDTIIYLDSSRCLKIAQDYYTKKVYDDTLVNNEDILISMVDTVHMNELKETKLYYFIKPQEVPIPSEKSYFSTGIVTSLNLNSINIVGGYTRKRLTYLGQYDLKRNIPSIGLIYNFK